MSVIRENVGKLKESYYEAFQIEWEIHNFKFEPRRTFKYDSPVFTFAENTWMLRLTDFYECIYVYVLNVEYNELKNVSCELGFKKTDGDIEYLPSTGFNAFPSSTMAKGGLLPKGRLQLLLEMLAPQNILTISCTMRLNSADSPTKSKSAAPLKLIKLDSLSRHFKNIFGNKETCDVILKVKEKVFHAHKTILIARSSVFAAMFHHDTSEKQTGIVTIPDCDADSFPEFLEYLYCGKLEDVSFCSVLHLYNTSDKYDVQELKSFCVDYMKQSLAPDNVCEVLTLANLYDDVELFSAAKGFFHENASEIVESPQWKDLMKDDYCLASKLVIDIVSKKRKKCHCSC